MEYAVFSDIVYDIWSVIVKRENNNAWTTYAPNLGSYKNAKDLADLRNAEYQERVKDEH